MANRIENTDLANPNALDKLIQGFVNAEERAKMLEDQLKSLAGVANKELGQIEIGSSEDVSKLINLVGTLTESVDKLVSAQKQQRTIEQSLTKEQRTLAKLERERRESTDETRKSIQRLRVERAQQNKIERRAAVQASESTTEYQKQSARLQQLRDIIKDAQLTGAEWTETLDNQQKELDELDNRLKQVDASVGQFQRNVGNYATVARETGRVNGVLTMGLQEQEAVLKQLQKEYVDLIARGEKGTQTTENLARAILELRGNVSGARDELKSLNDTTERTEKEARRAADGVDRLQREIDGLRNGAVAVSAVIAGGGVLGRALRSSQEGFDDLESTIAGVGTGVDAFLSGAIKSLGAFTSAFESTPATLANPLAPLNAGVSAFTDTLAKSTQQAVNAGIAIAEITRQQQRLVDQLAGPGSVASSGLLEELADLNLLFEQQSAFADQDTRSLEQRAASASALIGITTKLFNKEKEIAQAQIDIARQRVTVLEEQGLRARDAQLALAEAEVAFTEIQTREAQARIENTDRLLQILSDQKELDLDILIDAFDNQKSINERIIADERFTIEQRRKLLRETQSLQNTVERESISALQEQLDLQNLLNGVVGERIVIQDEFAKIQALSTDQQVEAIRALGLTEQLQTRFLEILRESRTATQDLNEATRDLNMEESERALRLANIEDQEQALNEAKQQGADIDRIREDLERRLRENRIEQLKQLIDEKDLTDELTKAREDLISVQADEDRDPGGFTAALNAQQELVRDLERRNEDVSELQEELNDLLLEGAEETQDALNERLKVAGDIAVQQLDIIEQGLDNLFEGINQRTASDIRNAEASIQRLSNLAQNQSEDAENNLAFEQQRLAQLELRQARELRRQQNLELGVAAFRAYAENAGEPNAVGKTLRDLATLAAGVAAISINAFDGTDDTGLGGTVDRKKGFLSILHPREQVWSKKDRQQVGMRSRQEIIDIVKGHDAKQNDFDVVVAPNGRIASQSDRGARYMREINNNLKKAVDKINTSTLEFDEISKSWKEERRRERRIERIHHPKSKGGRRAR